MSRTINRVELLGRVGTDPEMRYSQSGTAVATLRLATDRRRQSGETEADWHSIVCWGKQAEAVAEYVKKGNRLFVAGSLAQNTFEREDGLLVLVVPRQRLAVSARYLASHFSRIDCWAFPEPEREAYDQVVLLGYRKAEVFLDAYAEERIHQWAAGEAPELGPRRYPLYVAPATAAGDVLFATRTVDPVAAAEEARRSGLWASTAITDLLWPSQDQRTRPLMPLRRGHLAMLVAAGFLDNLQLEAGDSRILVKGRTSKEMVLAERTPTKETFRERLRTTVVALDLDSGQVTDIAA